ncbi:oxygenase MpaB family protein [Nocardia acidivorans]|uniref:oxygenase MpaB family protein n=1 Tax=Nocardia acidivorans TaxID=404580 RepID=UPI0009FEB558|nr:oxygenase MpaB family protein [Nocardia acidivorans]
MTLDAEPWDPNYDDPQGDSVGPPLTLEQTRIRIPGVHRVGAKRLPQLPDALDFWGLSNAPANVAMQMAWPEVGRGVVESPVESGALMSHPWKRLRTTASYLAVAILGTEAEKRAMREAVDVVHRQVRSEPGAKVRYNAFDRDTQLWVAACLYVGFEDSYQMLHGKMNAEQAEAFYSTAAALGTTLQVHPDMWPKTRADFDAYWVRACARVSIDEEVRAYLDDLLHLRMIHWYLRVIFGGLLRFLTAGFLAPHMREHMGVVWSAADQRRFEHLFLFVGFVNRFLPGFLRNVGGPQIGYVRHRIRRQQSLV